MRPMIDAAGGEAVVRLPKAFYEKASLKAAADAFVGRAKIGLLQGERGEHRVLLRPSRRKLFDRAFRRDREGLLALAGEFINEALSHQLRQEVIRFNNGLTAPVLGRLYEKGFLCVPWDPLEEMDRGLAGRRGAETEALIEEAIRMGRRR
ncbi:MAG: hypothetical protein ABII00_02435 [Elusimicrobiota bacterium]